MTKYKTVSGAANAVQVRFMTYAEHCFSKDERSPAGGEYKITDTSGILWKAVGMKVKKSDI